jgi:RHS repeat-associated protein
MTWTGDATGAVTATLRSDPWGNPGTTSGGALPDFRFQGSWYDTTAGLSWALARWYVPGLGRFATEDTLLGDPTAPESRHLYLFGNGDPVGQIDTSGRTTVSVSFASSYPYGDTDHSVANVIKLRISAGIGVGNYSAGRWGYLASAPVRYTGLTANSYRPETISATMTASTLSWSGNENLAILALGSMKWQAWHSLVDRTTGKTLVSLHSIQTAMCGAAWFPIGFTACQPFGDDLNGVPARMSYTCSCSDITYGHSYILIYQAGISLTASPAWLGLTLSHNADGFKGTMSWYRYL